jgi:hypothetical protein
MALLGCGLKSGGVFLTGFLVSVQWRQQPTYEVVIFIGVLGDVGVKFT